MSRDEDIVSTSAMRERYAFSLRRAEQIGIDCEEQVVKDVRRCHQYLRLAQTEMMRAAVMRLVKAWIVQGKFGTRGYYQGLSSVCVVFLVLFDMEEASAFSCLCVFLERHVLRPCSVPARAPVSSSRSPSRSPTKRMMRTPERGGMVKDLGMVKRGRTHHHEILIKIKRRKTIGGTRRIIH